MKFLHDNNLPPAIARALHALSNKEGHQATHLRDKFPANTTDVSWINSLKNKGGWSVISQDNFRKSDLEKQALKECGLIVFCLARHWSRAEYWDKAQNLVRWWPAIMEQAGRISGGAAFRVPWRMGVKGKFEQIVI